MGAFIFCVQTADACTTCLQKLPDCGSFAAVGCCLTLFHHEQTSIVRRSWFKAYNLPFWIHENLSHTFVMGQQNKLSRACSCTP